MFTGLLKMLLGTSSFYTANDQFLPLQLFGSIETQSPEMLTAK
jgi:hypothetical protein